jgi:hypothetical protein
VSVVDNVLIPVENDQIGLYSHLKRINVVKLSPFDKLGYLGEIALLKLAVLEPDMNGE